jgi:alpha-L-fucosidase
MTFSRRRFLATSAASLTAPLWLPRGVRAAEAAFQPTWESLAAGYQAPEWFRDAKFGIWAHWSAQCVPERGDWYARNMYQQGQGQYDWHVKKYGHPSQFGFMEIDNLWKAEHWDPQHLMGLYKAAGARYFVALANHHDNFDTYDSKHHAWNSVKVGPKKDIIGGWAKVAREHGLRFGVSNHSSHAWHWFQVAYGYDAEGPLAGVRYDADRLRKEDGKGKWWDGLDPQELYTGPNIRIPDGVRSIAEMKKWHEEHDGTWHEEPPPHNPEFARKWFLRCQDLLEQHRPDLLYFDDTGLPLGQFGLDITAWYYNASRQWHDGHLEAVVNGKNLTPQQRPALVEDIERGFSDSIRPLPWQTDTCIGDWHYNRAVFDEHRYKSAREVITRLCDIVSKNGNLLLSVPVRGDGTIDTDEQRVLEDLAGWMKVNGEAIFATRPWRVFGEGPTQVQAGMFGEQKAQPFTGRDVRFTTHQGTLYAIVLGKPEPTLTIKSLAATAPGHIDRVELLGGGGPLKFERDSRGLTVTFPPGPGHEMASVLRISGRGLTA